MTTAGLPERDDAVLRFHSHGGAEVPLLLRCYCVMLPTP